MKRTRVHRWLTLAAALTLAGSLPWAGTAGAGTPSEKPTIAKPCILCHEAQPGIVRGTLTNRSNKASTIQVAVGEDQWLIRFDDSTTVHGAKDLGSIAKDHEIAVAYTEKDGKIFAQKVTTKPAAKVAPEKLVNVDFVRELVKKTPEEGGYVLVDARPGPKYLEGFIPNAVSLPYPAFDKMAATVLPADKDILVVFYCGGVT